MPKPDFHVNTLFAHMPTLPGSFFVPGILTPSGVVHPGTASESTRFTIHNKVPAAAAAFGVPVPAHVETVR